MADKGKKTEPAGKGAKPTTAPAAKSRDEGTQSSCDPAAKPGDKATCKPAAPPAAAGAKPAEKKPQAAKPPEKH